MVLTERGEEVNFPSLQKYLHTHLQPEMKLSWVSLTGNSSQKTPHLCP